MGGRGTEGGMTRIMCWSKTQLKCPQPAVEQAAEGAKHSPMIGPSLAKQVSMKPILGNLMI